MIKVVQQIGIEQPVRIQIGIDIQATISSGSFQFVCF